MDFKNGYCDSVIYSVVQLGPDLYEICGKFDINVRCSIIMKKGLVWLSLFEEHVSLGYMNSRITYEYSGELASNLIRSPSQIPLNFIAYQIPSVQLHSNFVSFKHHHSL